MERIPQNESNKLLSLDVGLARIGVATCDPLGLAARPLAVIHRTSRRADFEQIARLVRTEGVSGVICGLPLNMDGSEGAQARTIRKWAERLAYALRALLGQPVPIRFGDERLSTFAAQALLAGAPSESREHGSEVQEDAAAAAVILQSYLDAQRRGEVPDLGEIKLSPRNSGDNHSIA
jgi:putative Holliday junction resolvase